MRVDLAPMRTFPDLALPDHGEVVRSPYVPTVFVSNVRQPDASANAVSPTAVSAYDPDDGVIGLS